MARCQPGTKLAGVMRRLFSPGACVVPVLPVVYDQFTVVPEGCIVGLNQVVNCEAVSDVKGQSLSVRGYRTHALLHTCLQSFYLAICVFMIGTR